MTQQQDTAGFECTHSLDIKIEQESYPLLAPVIHGIMTLPNFILSTLLTFQCIFTRMSAHPMGDSLHAGLGMTLTSESGTHEQADSFPSFQRPRCMQWSSHLLWLNIPLATDSSLFGLKTNTQYISLMSILVICTLLKFWVEEAQTWHLYEMEQSWRSIPLTLAWEYET